MGLRGTYPKPSKVRVMEGMRGHRPLNPNEPAYTPGIPEKPKGMSPAAKKVWDSLVHEMAMSGVLRLVDAFALCHISEDQATLDALRHGLAAQVREVVKKAKEKKQPLPGGGLVAISRTNEGRRTLSAIREISAQIIVQRREFGLTPSSATRVNAIGPGVVHIDELEADIA